MSFSFSAMSFSFSAGFPAASPAGFVAHSYHSFSRLFKSFLVSTLPSFSNCAFCSSNLITHYILFKENIITGLNNDTGESSRYTTLRALSHANLAQITF